jgi:hypothetical protein
VKAVERERRGGETVGGAVVAAKPREWKSSGGHGWDVIGVVWALTSGQ